MWLTDGRTDGRTPYHNTSEVLLRAYKKRSATIDLNFAFIVNFIQETLFFNDLAHNDWNTWYMLDESIKAI